MTVEKEKRAHGSGKKAGYNMFRVYPRVLILFSIMHAGTSLVGVFGGPEAEAKAKKYRFFPTASGITAKALELGSNKLVFDPLKKLMSDEVVVRDVLNFSSKPKATEPKAVTNLLNRIERNVKTKGLQGELMSNLGRSLLNSALSHPENSDERNKRAQNARTAFRRAKLALHTAGNKDGAAVAQSFVASTYTAEGKYDEASGAYVEAAVALHDIGRVDRAGMARDAARACQAAAARTTGGT